MVLAYGISPAFAVEFEHTHDHNGGHSSTLLDWLFDHDHHDHHDSPCDSHEGDDCSHTHVLFSGTSGHAANWYPASFPAKPGTTLLPLAEFGEFCPDNPTFGLLKPPQ